MNMKGVRWSQPAGAMWIVDVAGGAHDAVAREVDILLHDALAPLRAQPQWRTDKVFGGGSGGTFN